MGLFSYIVREGSVGDFDAPEIASGFRYDHPAREPEAGDVFYLPDGSGPWRVVDWMRTAVFESNGNCLVVERAG